MLYFRRGSSLILFLANKRSFKVLFSGSGIHLMEDPNLKETRWIDLTALPQVPNEDWEGVDNYVDRMIVSSRFIG